VELSRTLFLRSFSDGVWRLGNRRKNREPNLG